MGRNVEQIIATHPEIIMQGLQESDAKDEDIRASGIEIVFFNNWKEQSLLGACRVDEVRRDALRAQCPCRRDLPAYRA